MRGQADAETHVLDNPPPFHYKLLPYGERPYWSPDGERIAFIYPDFGDVHEINLMTREVRNLTGDLGSYHSFLRVLYLCNGDLLLIGPREYKDSDASRHEESELWLLDRNMETPPVPLGRRIYEGAGVSTIAPRITYAVSGRNDPSLGSPDKFECHVTEIEYGDDGPRLGADRVIYRAEGGYQPEPQDFRHNDTEVIFAEYDFRVGRVPYRDWRCVVKGVEVETGRVRTYINERQTHNECEGIFPDGEHICLESSSNIPVDGFTIKTCDLWKLKLDGSGRRVKMTDFYDRLPWLATNSNVSPDGRWLAFMTNKIKDRPGEGRGLGLLDLAAWEASSAAQQWESCSTEG